MDRALRNVRDLGDDSLCDAVRMLTLNPARSAGVADRKGLLRAGYDADLLIFDGSLTLQATLCRGVVGVRDGHLACAIGRRLAGRGTRVSDHMWPPGQPAVH